MQGWYNTVRVMYCIGPIQYCNVMYGISKSTDKVVFVHRRYGPILCRYSVLVYNLQLFAKIMFCLLFVSSTPFGLYFLILLDDIISGVNHVVISEVTDDVVKHDLISDASDHPAPKTNVSHPHPQG